MRRSPRMAAALLAALVLAACSDQLDVPTAVPRADSLAQARGGLRDAGISRGDSHFAARVVTTTETRDEGTALASGDLVATALADEVYVEGGYGPDGEIRYGVWFAPTAEPSVGSVRMVGDQISLYDHRGVFQESAVFDYFMAQLGLPGGTFAGSYFPWGPPGGGIGVQSAPPGSTITTDEAGDRIEVRVTVDGAGDGIGIAAGSGQGRSEMLRRYRRVSPGKGAGADGQAAWRLEESTHITRVGRPGAERITESRSTYTYEAFHRNPAKDAAREDAARRRPAKLQLTERRPDVAAASVLALPTALEPLAAGAPCAPSTFERHLWFSSEPTLPNLVYQHGFCSDARVWPTFDLMLRQRTPARSSQMYSLNSTRPVDEQATELFHKLGGGFRQRHLFIGHSQGGLVVRRLGQRYPELAQGVITIGTPHLGAYLANVAPNLVGDYLAREIAAGCFSSVTCHLYALIAGHLTGGALAGWTQGALVPALGDLRVGSAFTGTLNGTFESFPRVSISTWVPKRWALARFLGDGASPSEWLAWDRRPGGDALVTQVERVYAAAKFLRVASAHVLWSPAMWSGVDCNRPGYAYSWPACYDPFASQYWTQHWYTTFLMFVLHNIAGTIEHTMDAIDRFWDDATTRRFDSSDGLVQHSSQQYPPVPGTYPPLRIEIPPGRADSHAGQTKSPEVLRLTVAGVDHIKARLVP